MLRFIINIMLCSLLLIGCENEERIETLSVYPQRIDVDSYANEVFIEIESSSGWEISLPEDCDWVEPAYYSSYVGGKYKVQLYFDESDNSNARKATITVSNSKLTHAITISQGTPTMSISPGSFSLDASATTEKVTITSTIAWSAKSNVTWVTLSNKSGSAGTNNLTLNISKNDSSNSRSGYIEIYNSEFNISKKVNIKQSSCNLDVSQSSFDVGPEASSQEITIESDVDWIANASNTWITLSRGAGSAGTSKLTFYVSKNESENSRTGYVEISNSERTLSKKITIEQEFGIGVINVDKTSFNLSSSATSINAKIESNINWSTKVSDNWITISKSSGAPGATTLTIDIAKNTSDISRSGYIEIYNTQYNVFKKIEIVQEKFYPTLNVSRSTFNVSSDSSYINVTSTSNMAWTAKSSVNWISPNQSYGSAGTTTLEIYIDTNESNKSRSGYVEITGYEYNVSVGITINQKSINDHIKYTSTEQLLIGNTSGFGSNLISHTWDNGNGVLYFDGPITSIGQEAFRGCSKMTSIHIPSTVTEIGMSAFYECTSLTNITLPESVTLIENQAFYGCRNLSSVYCKATTPPTMDISGNTNVFYNNASGRKIYVPAGSVNAYMAAAGWSSYAKYIVGYDFVRGEVVPEPTKPANNEIWYTNGSTTTATTPYNSSAFEASIVSNFYNPKKECWIITFSANITKIGTNAYYGSSIRSISIPESVTEIGYEAFKYCWDLTSITIPNGLIKIGQWAFHTCDSLISIIIPNSVTTIGDYAFHDCDALTDVTIGNGIKRIGLDAFTFCNNLTSVYCKATNPPTGGDRMFYDNATNRKIYVPRNSVNAYKSAEGWSDYAADIVGYDF